ncbi:MAG: bifunctional imidazoleglycerol-phosphate dehydratase / histidinol-phosphatase HisB [Oceanicaulis sp. HLUCCA04]|nr:MAG: bifunctional imidazoleglycerol-phosphate dehydratase / histidinol-phosphatase HisB [Oceanicaulis sp. HLUCCA04]
MSAIMDLSAGPGTRSDLSRKALIARLSDVLSCDPARLVLALNAAAAQQALAAMDIAFDASRLAEGLAALESPSKEGVTLYLLGADTSDIVVIDTADPALAAKLTPHLSLPYPVFGPEILPRLSPAAILSAKADWDQRAALMSVCAARIGELTGAQVDSEGDKLTLSSPDRAALTQRLNALGLKLDETQDGFAAWVLSLSEAKALAAYLGGLKAPRTASIRRTTKETDIALFIDLDGEGGRFETGVHFFDHMLEQVSRHGGFRLDVVCEGDIEVDTHHTIEDVCLALGEGLRVALGDKAGIARFGFSLPMDETRAGVWIDLSGRPFLRFDGEIPGERVGDYPVDMCAHAFRSISETLKAAIHVEVSGDNPHHMIEACYKAFGRALRQAIRIEGAAIPSTKGVL